MKIHQHPDTDSPTLHLREGSEGVVGETMGQDLNENVVLHRDDAGTLYEIEVYGDASRVFDLTRLEVEGLPVNVSPRPGKKQSRSGTSPPGSNPPPRAKDLLE